MKPKKTIETLISYEAKQVQAEIVLSANETQNYLFGDDLVFKLDTSKYPEVNGCSLRERLAKKYKLKKENFTIGNGSTELLELIVKTYCESTDSVLTFDPSFSMYDIYASIYGVNIDKVPTGKQFIQSIDEMIKYDKKLNPKVIFVCNPNNPTGNLIKRENIIKLLNNSKALVVVDEAYMEFNKNKESVIDLVNQFDNLIVARTFSKAYGLAAARLGFVVANKNIIKNLLKVKLPYSVNSISIDLGIRALSKEKEMDRFINRIIDLRESLSSDLKQLGLVVYPSDGNFVYVQSDIDLFDYLSKKNILIRTFSNGYFRISIGTEEENKKLITILKEVIT